MKFKPTPDVEWIKSHFDYDPATGTFTHLKERGHRKVGDVAGWVKGEGRENGGYTQLTVDYKPYAAHRLAWKIMTGEDADGYIDHVNGNRADNSWSNLRLANAVENGRNRKLSRNSTTGKKGVIRLKTTGKYQASICLGTFERLEDAASAYDRAASLIHGDFARLNAENDNLRTNLTPPKAGFIFVKTVGSSLRLSCV